MALDPALVQAPGLEPELAQALGSAQAKALVPVLEREPASDLVQE